ncbi:MAG TPA: hypothetical protein VF525_05910 [Pyrinomonadaceae bacterium]|jgi:hypothetical protein
MAAEYVTAARSYTPPPALDRLAGTGLLVGLAALVVLIIGGALSALRVLPFDLAHVFRAYLLGYVLWTGVSVGAMAIMMLHHLSGGGWGVVLRRIFEAATRVLPLMCLLFIPIIAGLLTNHLYPWTIRSVVEESHAIQHKQALYLNWPMFLLRSVFYFAVWIGLATLLGKWSLAQDTADDPRVRRSLKERMQNLSGPGILLFGLTVTFAAIDWLMTLEPEWFSTIWGLLIMAGWGLSALAFGICIEAYFVKHSDRLTEVYQPRHLHDHGKLLLAFVMIWAYFSFSQFLITWSGNLPEEITWYLHRLRGGWQYVALFIVFFHFALPFVVLLSRSLKRHAGKLVIVALLVLAARVVDLFWLIAPSHAVFPEAQNAAAAGAARIVAYALYFVAPVGIGGVWLWYFARQLKMRPLLPLGDEGLENALEQGHGHH